MSEPFRVGHGSGVLEDEPIAFHFDGRRYTGLKGDTLASALLANGVRVVSRSLKHHRPRGISGMGVEEGSALVTVGQGAAARPNTPATLVEIEEGLEAFGQNAYPSVRFDLGAISGLFSSLIGAGFYYKTFIRPHGFWKRYEAVIRRAAGFGHVPRGADPDAYERVHQETDVLVVGSGASGLAAARAAAETGSRVLLVEQSPFLGGWLASAPTQNVGDLLGDAWLRQTLREIAQLPNVQTLSSATAFGHYCGGLFGIVERCPPGSVVRERLWHVVARRAIFATGAIERPLVFPDNDRPGIMLASATTAYLHRYGVAAGRTAAILTNNDSAYALLSQLQASGVIVAAVIDLRPVVPQRLRSLAEESGVRLFAGCAVVATSGRLGLSEIHIAAHSGSKLNFERVERIAVDHLAVSGGWTPTIHLHSQGRGSLSFAEAMEGFVPESGGAAFTSVGSANGTFDLRAAIEEGRTAGIAFGMGEAFFSCKPTPPSKGLQAPARIEFPAKLLGRCFVDLQNDVTAKDIVQAQKEGYSATEHLKRYTTLGMGTDQGKTANVNGAVLLAAQRETSVEAVGLTTYRPPYTPVTVGALVGRDIGGFAHPVRRTAVHEWHERHGAIMTNAGAWGRPLCFPKAGESVRQAAIREVTMVRGGVGLVDVSTLGKIDVQGRDAAEFLDRVYLNSWKKLAIGRARYGIMLRDDGAVFDDGVTARLGQDHFLMTTTTLNAEAVGEWLEFLLQTVWPDLEVFVTPVTDQWFAAALNGPLARSVLERVTDIDVSDTAFPHMAIREGDIAGIAGRILRISFSGELAYEINVPADFGLALWEALLDSGRDYAIAPYGVEAMATMRIEKGHVVIGAEADGRTSAEDLGFSPPKDEAKRFIGQRSLRLAAHRMPDRKQMVGVIAENASEPIPAGAHIVEQPHLRPQPTLGHVTSYAFSPTLGRDVGIALLQRGRSRIGDRLYLVSPVEGVCVGARITQPCHLDSEGRRARA